MDVNSLRRPHSFATGFAFGIGFYLLALATALLTAQFTPWGGPCTIGVPFALLLLGPAVGLGWSLALLGLIMLQRAGRFTYGCLSAHAVVLAAVYLLGLLL